jgi:hypothetical protein
LFLTHPRNANRQDLGCPFGCRQAHRSQNAVKRSIEYYRSPEGRTKKRCLNARRTDQCRKSVSLDKSIDGCGVAVDRTIVCHIQLTTSLIEGRAVSFEQIIKLIGVILRQHSIDKRKRLLYAGCGGGEDPP